MRAAVPAAKAEAVGGLCRHGQIGMAFEKAHEHLAPKAAGPIVRSDP